MSQDHHALLAPVLALSQDAGARIMEIYLREFAVTNKDNNTPLTEADMAAHETIVAGLRQLTPDIPVLSEESASIPYAERRTWERYWLVDPLDGTREFIKRNGEFTVNIALIDGHQPVLGVVYSPVKDLYYFAARNSGAFRKAGGNTAEAIHCRAHEPAKKTVVAGSRSHGGETLTAFVEKLNHPELISMGSSFKFCLVAEGRADIYPRFGPTSEWDTAAAQCVVEEAGGRVTDLTLQPLQYNRKESLLNPQFLVIGDPQYDWSAHL